MGNSCKLFFCGDVVISRRHQMNEIFTDEIIHTIREHNIACCNFEAPVIENKIKELTKVGPVIKQDASSISTLEEAGFNLFSLANNHIMDYGIEGLHNTIASIRNASYIGASTDYNKAYEHFEKDINGVRVCIMSVAENGFGAAINNKGGYAWFGDPTLTERIKINKEKSDFLIIICHAGAENWDYPLPEIRTLYKGWVDLGADLIIAHHPHVVQGWEKYNGGMIYYSLGNFYFEPRIGQEYTDTIGVSVELQKNKDPIFKELYFKKKETQLTMEENLEFSKHLQKCCEILEPNRYDEYNKKIDELCQSAYSRMYRSYYTRVLGIYNGGLIAVLKSIVRRWMLRERFSDIWLYHNIIIETHLWICKRALNGLINNRQS